MNVYMNLSNINIVLCVFALISMPQISMNTQLNWFLIASSLF